MGCASSLLDQIQPATIRPQVQPKNSNPNLPGNQQPNNAAYMRSQYAQNTGHSQQQYNGYSQQQPVNYPQQQSNFLQQQPNSISQQQPNGYTHQQLSNYSQQPNTYSQQPNTQSQQPNNVPQQQANNFPQQQTNNLAQQQTNNILQHQPINSQQQQANNYPKQQVTNVKDEENKPSFSNGQSKIINNNAQQNGGGSWYDSLLGGDDQKQQYRVTGKRGTMQLYSNKKDDFLTHHLKNQISLSKYSGAQKIRRRQIISHYRFQIFFHHGYGQGAQSLNEFALKSYLQRVLFQIFVDADKEFFQMNRSIDEVRHKIAERYLFQLYQLKQFGDAALGKFSLILPITQIPMSSTSVVSDSALYPALRYLKEKYPQVADQSKIQFPQVKQIKNDINLLDNFNSKCYSTPNLINIQTLFSDLKFLIDRSIQEFADFQKDMKDMLGQDVLTDSKVKKVSKNGKDEYTASPVRRVFIKWTQTIIERIPNIILSEAFLDFIKSKSKMADNFYFKSTIQPTTHSLVTQYLCNLLQSAKYDITTLAKTKQFGFYIYDLLRCKVKRNTGEQIVQVLKKMQATAITTSGKKFQVVRIKNRFKTPNRDLMVNFRYGDVIVGQAQLCIDTSDVSEKTKKINKFNHYIYELQRGLFGPTFQLIMQFQDFERKDISANLQAQGKVLQRKSKKPLSLLKKADRKCFHGHQMIQLVGNYFISDDKGQFADQTEIRCDYCLKEATTKTPYHYCYFCSILFCLNCHGDYKKQNLKQIQLICNKDSLVQNLKSQNQLRTFFSNNSTPIIVFYISLGSANVVFKDSLIYYMCVYKMQKKKSPQMAFFNCDDPSTKSMLERFNVKIFPTTVLFDKNMIPQISLVGASFSQIQGIFQSQKLLSQNRLKCLPIKCFCGQGLSYVSNQNGQDFSCSYCGNSDKSQGYLDYFMGQNKSQLFACTNNHYRCYTCSYLAVKQPTRFRDYLGRSYLCNQRIVPSPQSCPKKHPINYSFVNSYKKIQFKCFKCNSQFYFNDQLGMGSCNDCQVFTCPGCHSIKQATLADSKGQLISHTVQSTAEEGQKCICGRLFKKVYNTRLYQKQAEQQGNNDQFTAILNSVFNEKQHNWTCIICQRVKVDGELHLACFRCPRLENSNIQICIQCSIGSNLLNQIAQEKHLQIQGDFVCKLNHKVVRSRVNYDTNSMTYDCSKCKTTFYANTQRYYCKTCKTNTCQKCSKKQLKNIKPPSCLRKCQNNHNLVPNQNPAELRFCDGCRTVIRKLHFVCIQACGFELCLPCAATPPGINTMKMKHIQDERVKKEMAKYLQWPNYQNYINNIFGQDQNENGNSKNNKQGQNSIGGLVDDLFGW